MIRSTILRVSLLLFTLLLPASVLAEKTVCVACHESQGGIYGEAVTLWQESVHAENGISCHHCHGGDPTDAAMAMSPQRGFAGAPAAKEIPEFCGRCHVGVKEDYLESAHGQALGAGGPNCVTCHGNHGVARATPALINPADCSRCHEYGRAEEIKGAVAATDRTIDGLEESLNKLHRIGIATEEMRGRVFSLRNQFHRLFHSVDVETVRGQTAGIQEKLAEVRQLIDALNQDLRQRKLWGAGVVGLLLLGAVFSALLRRSYKEEEENSEDP